LILCRNLFIYLTPDGRRRAMAALDRLLASDGWLCLTPGEADRLPPGSFAPVAPTEFGIYRRASARSALFAVVEVQRPAPSQPSVIAEPLPDVQPPVPTLAPVPPQPSLELARALADAGRLAAARELCESLLRDGAGTPEAHTLLGVVHQAEGHPDAAVEAFRKALYLAPGHREALSHMIVLCDRKGDAAQAAAFRQRLARVGGEDAT
jgi:chemotaxis protein methyltransferase WspC